VKLENLVSKILVISLFAVSPQLLVAQEVNLNESFSDIIEERTAESTEINPLYPIEHEELLETEELTETDQLSEIDSLSDTENLPETEELTDTENFPEPQPASPTEDQPEQNPDNLFENPINLAEEETTPTEDLPEEETAIGGIGVVPPAKRPKPIDKEKADKAAEKDETKDEYENNMKTIRYGLPSEIGNLLDDIIKNDDPRYTEEIYDLFQNTSNASIKEKVLKYFTKTEDPCLEDFAVNLMNDPYDEKKDVVNATFKYIEAVKTTAAVPPIITLLEAENEDYFNNALATIGAIGGKKEAKFIAEYLERDDLSDAQRQTLMRTLGKMKALNCWNQIVDILNDEDENAFVRMYAAEALGTMEKAEAVPILVRNYSASDPNLRQYVIKGLGYYPDVLEAQATIIQAVRDEHWKVRQEAIGICKEKEFEDAVPYLIYRAKNDSEKIIKNASYEAIAKLNTKEGNEFLVDLVTDKKAGDSSKQKAIEVLLKEGKVGEKEILELAASCVDDDKKKNLRYAIGKELAKNSKPEFEEICSKYLASKDATTIGLGLDMYKNCKFPALEPQMREIAKDKKANSSIKTRIKKMLDIQDEEESKEEKKEEPAPKAD